MLDLLLSPTTIITTITVTLGKQCRPATRMGSDQISGIGSLASAQQNSARLVTQHGATLEQCILNLASGHAQNMIRFAHLSMDTSARVALPRKRAIVITEDLRQYVRVRDMYIRTPHGSGSIGISCLNPSSASHVLKQALFAGVSAPIIMNNLKEGFGFPRIL